MANPIIEEARKIVRDTEGDLITVGGDNIVERARALASSWAEQGPMLVQGTAPAPQSLTKPAWNPSAAAGAGLASVVSGFGPSAMETARVEAELNDPVALAQRGRNLQNHGTVNPVVNFSTPPLTEEEAIAKGREDAEKELAFRNAWADNVNGVADWLRGPETQAPQGWGQTAADWLLRTAPGVAVELAKWGILGAPIASLWNTYSGNAAARKRAYQQQIAQGVDHQTAYDQANDWGWNAADVAARGAVNAATVGLLGSQPNVYGAWDPIAQKAAGIGGAAAVSGLGGAAESAIGDKMAGQDVDWANAARQGAGQAATTGLFGLLNAALNGRKLWQMSKDHRFLKRFNEAVTKRGFRPVDEIFGPYQSMEQIKRAAQEYPEMIPEIRRMLDEAGVLDNNIAGELECVSKV